MGVSVGRGTAWVAVACGGGVSLGIALGSAVTSSLWSVAVGTSEVGVGTSFVAVGALVAVGSRVALATVASATTAGVDVGAATAAELACSGSPMTCA
jgi:hypothetical protein